MPSANAKSAQHRGTSQILAPRMSIHIAGSFPDVQAEWGKLCHNAHRIASACRVASGMHIASLQPLRRGYRVAGRIYLIGAACVSLLHSA
ncbi:hypothetical protein WM40_18020 [Robbsia andropogonis]|uniref:Uncharacterized protein n=1 Tax=Robbsia andropogonis TaxID=28092 RepID=A0A0F5JWW3_9BURK|nr:hypothetical protein WM40_18020 [Robbsia andropogonis]